MGRVSFPTPIPGFVPNVALGLGSARLAQAGELMVGQHSTTQSYEGLTLMIPEKVCLPTLSSPASRRHLLSRTLPDSPASTVRPAPGKECQEHGQPWGDGFDAREQGGPQAGAAHGQAVGAAAAR